MKLSDKSCLTGRRHRGQKDLSLYMFWGHQTWGLLQGNEGRSRRLLSYCQLAKFKGMDFNQEQIKLYCLFESLNSRPNPAPWSMQLSLKKAGSAHDNLSAGRLHFQTTWLKGHQVCYKTLGDNKKKHLGEPGSIPHFHFLARNISVCCLLWFYVQVNFWAIVKRRRKLMAGNSHLLQSI